jgi:hypothetical protein
MTRFAKCITALLGGLATWGVTAAPDGYTDVELWGLCAVVAAALAVYAIPNERPVDEPYDPDISEREPDDGLPASVAERRRRINPEP